MSPIMRARDQHNSPLAEIRNEFACASKRSSDQTHMVVQHEAVVQRISNCLVPLLSLAGVLPEVSRIPGPASASDIEAGSPPSDKNEGLPLLSGSL